MRLWRTSVLLISLVSIDANAQVTQLTPAPPAPASPGSPEEEYVRALLTRFVPEIRRGVVVIRGIARVPGVYTKVALESLHPSIDPIEAAVGRRGSRIKRVVVGIRGEAIDLIPWNSDPPMFAAAAVAPIDVPRVIVDDEAHLMILIIAAEDKALMTRRHLRGAEQVVGWSLLAMTAAEYAEYDQLRSNQFH